MARGVVRRKTAAWVCGLAVLLAACAVESYLAVTRGHGFVVRLLPDDWFASRDLVAVGEYCRKYADEHNRTRPDPHLVVQNVPYVRLAQSQPYLKHRMWVLESTESNERYLYRPYEMWHAGSRRPVRVYACNMAQIRGSDGRYWVYSRDPARDHHVVAEAYGRGINLWTAGLPVVPGCVFEGDPGKRVRVPMEPDVVEALRACYPDVRIPPDLIAGD